MWASIHDILKEHCMFLETHCLKTKTAVQASQTSHYGNPSTASSVSAQEKKSVLTVSRMGRPQLQASPLKTRLMGFQMWTLLSTLPIRMEFMTNVSGSRNKAY